MSQEPEYNMDDIHGISDIEQGQSAEQSRKEVRNQNVKGLVSSPNTRPKVIFTAVALMFSAVIGLVLINKGNSEAADDSEVSLANPNIRGTNNVTLNPGSSQAYNDLKMKDNEQKAKEAESKGGAHIEIPVVAAKKEVPVEEVTQPQITNIQQPVAPAVYNRDVTYDGGMQAQLSAILANFEYKAPRTTLIQPPQQQGNAESQTSALTQVAANNTPAAPENNFFIRAGTIALGTIDMEANSDEPGEILATIHSGELKGAKAICNFTKGKEALKLTCPLVSPTWGKNSVTANILLIDPDTNRASMATEVDRHYIERYGLILAASFVQGLGEAAIRANSVISTSPLGSTQTQGKIDPSDTLLVAAGRAGAAASSELSRRGDIPVTVKVRAGQAVGFLFLSDFKANRPIDTH